MCSNGEVIHLHVGQAGVQIANACWELYCLEHGICANGYLHGCPSDESFTTFFAHSSTPKVVPRLVMVDSEPTVIDEVRAGTYGHLFKPDTLITGKEDSGSNFARGYCTLGAELIDVTMNSIRSVAEACSSLKGFIGFRSIGGGTGSGLGDRIMEHIVDEYGKITKMDFIIFPSSSSSPLIVDSYNSLLGTHIGMDSSDCTFVLDNEALYDICETKLDVPNPTYTNLNRIIAQAISAMTASLRFYGSTNVAFAEFQTNLVPFPRIHFPLVSYAPLITMFNSCYTEIGTEQLTLDCFQPSSQLVRCDPAEGKYMSCVVLYRGNVAPADINTSIKLLKSKNALQFVDWSPTGFKIGINAMPPCPVPGGDIGTTDRAMMALSNNTIIRKAWCRLLAKFNQLFERRAFIHHFASEGMEEDTFIEASDNICSLIEDYLEAEGDSNGDDICNQAQQPLKNKSSWNAQIQMDRTENESRKGGINDMSESHKMQNNGTRCCCCPCCCEEDRDRNTSDGNRDRSVKNDLEQNGESNRSKLGKNASQVLCESGSHFENQNAVFKVLDNNQETTTHVKEEDFIGDSSISSYLKLSQETCVSTKDQASSESSIITITNYLHNYLYARNRSQNESYSVSNSDGLLPISELYSKNKDQASTKYTVSMPAHRPGNENASDRNSAHNAPEKHDINIKHEDHALFQNSLSTCRSSEDSDGLTEPNRFRPEFRVELNNQNTNSDEVALTPISEPPYDIGSYGDHVPSKPSHSSVPHKDALNLRSESTHEITNNDDHTPSKSPPSPKPQGINSGGNAMAPKIKCFHKIANESLRSPIPHKDELNPRSDSLHEIANTDDHALSSSTRSKTTNDAITSKPSRPSTPHNEELNLRSDSSHKIANNGDNTLSKSPRSSKSYSFWVDLNALVTKSDGDGLAPRFATSHKTSKNGNPVSSKPSRSSIPERFHNPINEGDHALYEPRFQVRDSYTTANVVTLGPESSQRSLDSKSSVGQSNRLHRSGMSYDPMRTTPQTEISEAAIMRKHMALRRKLNIMTRIPARNRVARNQFQPPKRLRSTWTARHRQKTHGDGIDSNSPLNFHSTKINCIQNNLPARSSVCYRDSVLPKLDYLLNSINDGAQGSLEHSRSSQTRKRSRNESSIQDSTPNLGSALPVTEFYRKDKDQASMEHTASSKSHSTEVDLLENTSDGNSVQLIPEKHDQNVKDGDHALSKTSRMTISHYSEDNTDELTSLSEGSRGSSSEEDCALSEPPQSPESDRFRPELNSQNTNSDGVALTPISEPPYEIGSDRDHVPSKPSYTSEAHKGALNLRLESSHEIANNDDTPSKSPPSPKPQGNNSGGNAMAPKIKCFHKIANESLRSPIPHKDELNPRSDSLHEIANTDDYALSKSIRSETINDATTSKNSRSSIPHKDELNRRSDRSHKIANNGDHALSKSPRSETINNAITSKPSRSSIPHKDELNRRSDRSHKIANNGDHALSKSPRSETINNAITSKPSRSSIPHKDELNRGSDSSHEIANNDDHALTKSPRSSKPYYFWVDLNALDAKSDGDGPAPRFATSHKTSKNGNIVSSKLSRSSIPERLYNPVNEGDYAPYEPRFQIRNSYTTANVVTLGSESSQRSLDSKSSVGQSNRLHRSGMSYDPMRTTPQTEISEAAIMRKHMALRRKLNIMTRIPARNRVARNQFQPPKRLRSTWRARHRQKMHGDRIDSNSPLNFHSTKINCIQNNLHARSSVCDRDSVLPKLDYRLNSINDGAQGSLEHSRSSQTRKRSRNESSIQDSTPNLGSALPVTEFYRKDKDQASMEHTASSKSHSTEVDLLENTSDLNSVQLIPEKHDQNVKDGDHALSKTSRMTISHYSEDNTDELTSLSEGSRGSSSEEDCPLSEPPQSPESDRFRPELNSQNTNSDGVALTPISEPPYEIGSDRDHVPSKPSYTSEPHKDALNLRSESTHEITNNDDHTPSKSPPSPKPQGNNSGGNAMASKIKCFHKIANESSRSPTPRKDELNPRSDIFHEIANNGDHALSKSPRSETINNAITSKPSRSSIPHKDELNRRSDRSHKIANNGDHALSKSPRSETINNAITSKPSRSSIPHKDELNRGSDSSHEIANNDDHALTKSKRSSKPYYFWVDLNALDAKSDGDGPAPRSATSYRTSNDGNRVSSKLSRSSIPERLYNPVNEGDYAPYEPRFQIRDSYTTANVVTLGSESSQRSLDSKSSVGQSNRLHRSGMSYDPMRTTPQTEISEAAIMRKHMALRRKLNIMTRIPARNRVARNQFQPPKRLRSTWRARHRQKMHGDRIDSNSPLNFHSTKINCIQNNLLARSSVCDRDSVLPKLDYRLNSINDGAQGSLEHSRSSQTRKRSRNESSIQDSTPNLGSALPVTEFYQKDKDQASMEHTASSKSHSTEVDLLENTSDGNCVQLIPEKHDQNVKDGDHALSKTSRMTISHYSEDNTDELTSLSEDSRGSSSEEDCALSEPPQSPESDRFRPELNSQNTNSDGVALTPISEPPYEIGSDRDHVPSKPSYTSEAHKGALNLRLESSHEIANNDDTPSKSPPSPKPQGNNSGGNAMAPKIKCFHKIANESLRSPIPHKDELNPRSDSLHEIANTNDYALSKSIRSEMINDATTSKPSRSSIPHKDELNRRSDSSHEIANNDDHALSKSPRSSKPYYFWVDLNALDAKSDGDGPAPRSATSYRTSNDGNRVYSKPSRSSIPERLHNPVDEEDYAPYEPRFQIRDSYTMANVVTLGSESSQNSFDSKSRVNKSNRLHRSVMSYDPMRTTPQTRISEAAIMREHMALRRKLNIMTRIPARNGVARNQFQPLKRLRSTWRARHRQKMHGDRIDSNSPLNFHSTKINCIQNNLLARSSVSDRDSVLPKLDYRLNSINDGAQGSLEHSRSSQTRKRSRNESSIQDSTPNLGSALPVTEFYRKDKDQASMEHTASSKSHSTEVDLLENTSDGNSVQLIPEKHDQNVKDGDHALSKTSRMTISHYSEDNTDELTSLSEGSRGSSSEEDCALSEPPQSPESDRFRPELNSQNTNSDGVALTPISEPPYEIGSDRDHVPSKPSYTSEPHKDALNLRSESTHEITNNDDHTPSKSPPSPKPQGNNSGGNAMASKIKCFHKIANESSRSPTPRKDELNPRSDIFHEIVNNGDYALSKSPRSETINDATTSKPSRSSIPHKDELNRRSDRSHKIANNGDHALSKSPRLETTNDSITTKPSRSSIPHKDELNRRSDSSHEIANNDDHALSKSPRSSKPYYFWVDLNALDAKSDGDGPVPRSATSYRTSNDGNRVYSKPSRSSIPERLHNPVDEEDYAPYEPRFQIRDSYTMANVVTLGSESSQNSFDSKSRVNKSNRLHRSVMSYDPMRTTPQTRISEAAIMREHMALRRKLNIMTRIPARNGVARNQFQPLKRLRSTWRARHRQKTHGDGIDSNSPLNLHSTKINCIQHNLHARSSVSDRDSVLPKLDCRLNSINDGAQGSLEHSRSSQTRKRSRNESSIQDSTSNLGSALPVTEFYQKDKDQASMEHTASSKSHSTEVDLLENTSDLNSVQLIPEKHDQNVKDGDHALSKTSRMTISHYSEDNTDELTSLSEGSRGSSSEEDCALSEPPQSPESDRFRPELNSQNTNSDGVALTPISEPPYEIGSDRDHVPSKPSYTSEPHKDALNLRSESSHEIANNDDHTPSKSPPSPKPQGNNSGGNAMAPKIKCFHKIANESSRSPTPHNDELNPRSDRSYKIANNGDHALSKSPRSETATDVVTSKPSRLSIPHNDALNPRSDSFHEIANNGVHGLSKSPRSSKSYSFWVDLNALDAKADGDGPAPRSATSYKTSNDGDRVSSKPSRSSIPERFLNPVNEGDYAPYEPRFQIRDSYTTANVVTLGSESSQNSFDGKSSVSKSSNLHRSVMAYDRKRSTSQTRISEAAIMREHMALRRKLNIMTRIPARNIVVRNDFPPPKKLRLTCTNHYQQMTDDDGIDSDSLLDLHSTTINCTQAAIMREHMALRRKLNIMTRIPARNIVVRNDFPPPKKLRLTCTNQYQQMTDDDGIDSDSLLDLHSTTINCTQNNLPARSSVSDRDSVLPKLDCRLNSINDGAQSSLENSRSSQTRKRSRKETSVQDSTSNSGSALPVTEFYPKNKNETSMEHTASSKSHCSGTEIDFLENASDGNSVHVIPETHGKNVKDDDPVLSKTSRMTKSHYSEDNTDGLTSISESPCEFTNEGNCASSEPPQSPKPYCFRPELNSQNTNSDGVALTPISELPYEIGSDGDHVPSKPSHSSVPHKDALNPRSESPHEITNNDDHTPSKSPPSPKPQGNNSIGNAMTTKIKYFHKIANESSSSSIPHNDELNPRSDRSHKIASNGDHALSKSPRSETATDVVTSKLSRLSIPHNDELNPRSDSFHEIANNGVHALSKSPRSSKSYSFWVDLNALDAKADGDGPAPRSATSYKTSNDGDRVSSKPSRSSIPERFLNPVNEGDYAPYEPRFQIRDSYTTANVVTLGSESSQNSFDGKSSVSKSSNLHRSVMAYDRKRSTSQTRISEAAIMREHMALRRKLNIMTRIPARNIVVRNDFPPPKKLRLTCTNHYQQMTDDDGIDSDSLLDLHSTTINCTQNNLPARSSVSDRDSVLPKLDCRLNSINDGAQSSLENSRSSQTRKRSRKETSVQDSTSNSGSALPVTEFYPKNKNETSMEHTASSKSHCSGTEIDFLENASDGNSVHVIPETHGKNVKDDDPALSKTSRMTISHYSEDNTDGLTSISESPCEFTNEGDCASSEPPQSPKPDCFRPELNSQNTNSDRGALTPISELPYEIGSDGDHVPSKPSHSSVPHKDALNPRSESSHEIANNDDHTPSKSPSSPKPQGDNSGGNAVATKIKYFHKIANESSSSSIPHNDELNPRSDRSHKIANNGDHVLSKSPRSSKSYSFWVDLNALNAKADGDGPAPRSATSYKTSNDGDRVSSKPSRSSIPERLHNPVNEGDYAPYEPRFQIRDSYTTANVVTLGSESSQNSFDSKSSISNSSTLHRSVMSYDRKRATSQTRISEAAIMREHMALRRKLNIMTRIPARNIVFRNDFPPPKKLRSTWTDRHLQNLHGDDIDFDEENWSRKSVDSEIAPKRKSLSGRSKGDISGYSDSEIPSTNLNFS